MRLKNKSDDTKKSSTSSAGIKQKAFYDKKQSLQTFFCRILQNILDGFWLADAVCSGWFLSINCQSWEVSSTDTYHDVVLGECHNQASEPSEILDRLLKSPVSMVV